MALGFSSALSGAGMEVARGFVAIGYDDSAVEAGIAKTEAATTKGVGALNKLSLGLVAFTGASIVMAAKFDDQMSHIQASLGLSVKMTNQWKAGVLAISQETGVGTVPLANALLVVGKNGYRGAAALEILAQSAKASKIGLGDTADIAKVVSQAMNIYADSNLTAARATDIFVAAAKEANITPQQLSLTLGRVGPLAAKLGIGLDQVAGAAAVLARNGVPARTAVSGLMAVFNLILNPTKKTKAALDSIHLSAGQLKYDLGHDGLYGTLQVLNAATKGNAQALDDLFGSAAKLPGVFALVGTKASQNAAIFDQVTKSAGITNDEFATSEKSLVDTMQRAFASVKVFAIELGQTFIPAMKQVASVLGTVAGFLARHTGLVRVLSSVIKLATGIWLTYRLTLLAVNTATKTLNGVMALTGKVAKTSAGEAVAASKTQIIWTDTAEGKVAVLNTTLVATGPAAVEGAAVAKPALVGVGVTATEVTGEVDTLKASLLGLGAPEVLAAVAGIFVAEKVSSLTTSLSRSVFGEKGWTNLGTVKTKDRLGNPEQVQLKNGKLVTTRALDYTTGKFVGGKTISVNEAARLLGVSPAALKEYISESEKAAKDKKLTPFQQFAETLPGGKIKQGQTSAVQTGTPGAARGAGRAKPPPPPWYLRSKFASTSDLPTNLQQLLANAGLTKSTSDDIAADKAVVAWYEEVEKDKRLTSTQVIAIKNNIGTLDSQIWSDDTTSTNKAATAKRKREAAARKAAAARKKAAAAAVKRILTIPPALQIKTTLDEGKENTAESTGTFNAQQAALKRLSSDYVAEETYLQKQIDSHKLHGANLEKLVKELVAVQEKNNAIRKKLNAQQNILAQQKLAFLTARTGFFGQFAPTVYHHGSGGNSVLGSDSPMATKTVHVHQNFLSPPVSHFVNARQAAAAAAASF